MPFIAYGGARPSTGLGHVCSCLFNESLMSDILNRCPHDHGPTNVRAMVKREMDGGQKLVILNWELMFLGFRKSAIQIQNPKLVILSPICDFHFYFSISQVL